MNWNDRNIVGGDLWIEVNLDALAHNMRIVRTMTKAPLVCAVVKADGYGCGAAHIAKTLLDNGADYLAVATAREAFELRQVVDAPILVLCEVNPVYAPEFARKKISVAAGSATRVRAYSEALAASDCNQPLLVHIKVETGMNRMGFLPKEEMADSVLAVSKMENIVIEGVFSHFARAEEPVDCSDIQAKKFFAFLKLLEERGIYPRIRHLVNSAATVSMKEYHLDMVRVGALIYGIFASEESRAFDLKPVLSLKSRVSFVKTMAERAGISYGHNHTVEKGTVVATVYGGYGDGISRAFSGKMDVLIRGRRCKQVGNICMSNFMVEGFDGIEQDDEVVILGYSESEGGDGCTDKVCDTITMEEMAGRIGSISAEILCMLGKRIPRIYIGGELM